MASHNPNLSLCLVFASLLTATLRFRALLQKLILRMKVRSAALVHFSR